MSPDATRAEDLRINALSLLEALLARAVRILAVSALMVAVAYGILMFVPRVYESSASLLVESREGAFMRSAAEVPVGSAALSAEAVMSSQIELIKSRDLLLEVVDAENLRSLPEFSGIGFSPLTLLLQAIGGQPESRGLDQTVLNNLADRMTVSRERQSAVISIVVRSIDPEVAARIANAIAAAHVKRRAAQSVTDAAEATVWLQQEIDKLRSKVTAAEAAVANYRVDNDLFVGSDHTPLNDQQLGVISTQVAEAQQRKNDAQSRAELIRNLVDTGQSLEGVADVRNSVVIQSLLQSKANLQGELALKSTTLLANHPTIRSLRAQIAEIEDQIAAEGRRVADSLEAEAKVEAGLEQKLRDDLARTKLVAGDATKGSVTLDGLEREAKAQRDLLTDYLARYAEATSRSAANGALPDVRIVSEAAPSVEPASPNVMLILGAVGVIALALQVGAVVFGELTSGRASVAGTRFAPQPLDAGEFEADEELEAEAALESEPSDPEVELPLMPMDDELGQLSAAVTSHQLRTVLLARLGDAGLPVVDRVIEDTLAAGLSVVVVDAGSGEPTEEAGLTDLAAERADYGDVLLRGGENLAEVPWGRLASLDRRSERPLTLIVALADIYHVVLVDTGRVGMASALPLFAGARATVVLVADDTDGPVAIGAARRDVAALGFDVGRVVTLPTLRAEVA